MKVNIKNPKISTSFKTERVYPELEDLEVTPTIEEQNFKSSKYGFDNVTVKAVEGETLEVTPSKETQNFTGLYEEVNVKGIEGETLEITPTIEAQEHTGIFDKVNVKGIETEELNITPSIEEQTFTGIYDNVNVSKITSDLIPNLTPENIAEGEQVLDLVGTHKGEAEVGLPIKITNINGTVQVDFNGKNYFNGTLKSGLYRVSDGVTYDINDSYVCSATYINVSGLTDITVSNKGGLTGVYYVLQYDSNKKFLGGEKGSKGTSFSCTLANNTKYIRVEIGNSSNPPTVETLGDFQIEEGTIATEYEPFAGIELINSKRGTIPVTENNDIIISSSSSGEIIEVSEINVTPNTEEQVYDGLYNKVTVEGESNLVPDNIKEGTNIFGVEGTAKTTNVKITDASNLFREGVRLDIMNELLSLCENITNTNYMFYSNYSNNDIDLSNLDTSNVVRTDYMFYKCPNLKNLDLSNADLGKDANISFMFYSCRELINLKSFKNLGKGYTQKTNNYSNYKLDLKDCKSLTKESLLDVITNGLYDLNLTYDVANGGTLYRQSLILGETNLAKLTAEEIAIATNKGWDVT